MRDIDGDGLITTRSEVSFTDGQEGVTDLDKLGTYDTNADGVIDASDAIFSELQIWLDANGNGVVDTGELTSFADAGIVSVDATPTAVDPNSPDVVYWFDANGDGLMQLDEIYATAAEAPVGAIAAQRVDGGFVFQTTTITTLTGTLTAYAVGLDYDPNGVRLEVDGEDLTVVYDDGRRDVFRAISDAAGVYFDLGGTNYVGVIGNSGDDTLIADATRDAGLLGGDGNDILLGGDGDDLISGGQGSDSLVGGAGNDIVGFDAADLALGVSGGDGYDIAIVETADAVSLDLGATGFEAAIGNDGADVFEAGEALGLLLDGGSGADTLIGGDGEDEIRGGAGADVLRGGTGDDVLTIDADDVVVDGGDGIDVVFVEGAAGVALDLTASSVEIAFGGDGADSFTASDTVDLMVDGGAGNDTITTSDGYDLLTGGAGNDVISAGGGLDVAFYAGAAAGYGIVDHGGGLYVVTDTDASDGDDGTDTLEGVERLIFADATVHLDDPNNRPMSGTTTWKVRDTGTDVVLGAAGLTNGIFDADRDLLKATAISRAEGADVSITAKGDVLFDANGTGAGVGDFKYQVDDGHGGTNWITSNVQYAGALPTDELFPYQWALEALNVFDIWDDYTGAGVKIVLRDEGIDASHPDVAPNYAESLEGAGVGLGGGHGTYVTSLAGGARNGEGIVGVAYDAMLAVYTMPYTLLLTFVMDDASVSQLGAFDVIGNSWENSTVTLHSRETLEDTISGKSRAVAEQGRGGLGSVVVFSAANDRASGGDSNESDGLNSRHAIMVAATDENGKVAGFSNPGTSILVSAPGVDIVGADIVGSGGMSAATATFGPDYAVASGTSAAQPLVAGVVALMLEANFDLGWRDVQEILAYSAWNSDPESSGWSTNGATNWNGGGLHVNRDYGFGMVDARVAVRLAETWQTTKTSANEDSVTGASTVSGAIPDNTGEAFSSSIMVTEAIEIDHVEVILDITHPTIGDLVVELTSPDGTRSVILNRVGVDPGSTTDRGSTADDIYWRFTTTHHWGEDSAGEWTLRVWDRATGDVGTVEGWSLRIYGDAASADDTYIYTVDFGSMTGGVDAARRLLSDDGGHDVINAAPIFTDAMLDMRAGSVSQLAGNTLTIAEGTIIEDAFLGDGNDIVIGNEVANAISGGRGDDTIVGSAGADTLDGAQGRDWVYYLDSSSGVSIDLEAGTASGGDAQGDVLASVENLGGSAFADSLAGNAEANYLSGDEGDDLQVGKDGDDTLVGGAGTDTLLGGTGDDQLFGGDGNDSLDGGAGSADTARYRGVLADYTISTVGGATIVDGLDGQDTLTGVEFLSFQDHTIYIAGPNAAPTATGLSYTLTQRGAFAMAQGTFLAGAADADSDALSLYAVYASQNGLVTLTSTNDVRFTIDADFVGTTAFDFSVTDGKGGEALATASFTVASTYTFVGTSGGDAFLGLGSADSAAGFDGTDLLDGGFGADTLSGGAGSDTLVGGAGADILDGGDGADAASYETATSGLLVDLVGTSTGDAANDTFVGIENLIGSAFGDTLFGDGNANLLSGLGGDDVLRGRGEADTLDGGAGIDIASYVDASAAVTVNLKTATFSGADIVGDVFISIEGVQGSSFNDSLTGSDAADVLAGAAGNDTLTGLLGSDEYRYVSGDGDDRIVEGAAATDYDRLVLSGAGMARSAAIVRREASDLDDIRITFAGVSGSIVLDEQVSDAAIDGQGQGVEEIEFLGGAVWTASELRAAYLKQMRSAGNDTIYGFKTADLLAGGAGNDSLRGGNGADTYSFNVGDGQDTIFDGGPSGEIDTLLLGAGILTTDVLVRAGDNGNDLVLTFAGNPSDRITLDNRLTNSSGGADVIVFSDSTVWDYATLVAKSREATEGNDAIYGDSAADSFAGLGGADSLVGNNGNDTLQGDAGTDSLSGGNGDDVLAGGSDNDSLYGGNNNDILDGGADNDRLEGGNDNDIYLFGLGGGQDTVVESGGTDTLDFGAGIAAADIIGTKVGNDMILSIASTTDTITVTSQFDTGATYKRVDTVRFADGTTWDYAAMLAEVLTPSEGNDTLTGDNGDNAFGGAGGNDSLVGNYGHDTIHGGAGNDSLYGGNNNDVLDGGAGNDRLEGGADNDVYLFALGGGQDTVVESGGTDTLDFGAGITAADIVGTKVGNDMILSIAGTTDTITVIDQFDTGGTWKRVETVRFADGTTWDYAAMLAEVLTPTSGNDTLTGDNGDNAFGGAGGDDSLVGNYGNDTIDGGGGNDSLYGGNNNDVLDGGAGNDRLEGGNDNDTYLFGLGGGQDTVVESGGTDTLDFGAGIAVADIVGTKVGNDMILSIAGTTDKITVTGQFDTGGTWKRVETVRFADGTTWDYAAMLAEVLTPSSGNDTLTGDNGDNAFGGAGGNDSLVGNWGHDTIDGGAGNDSLYGGNGNDVLDGGADNDRLDGGVDHDTYLFGLGGGQDTIVEASGTDTLSFGAGIVTADIVGTRVGNDLVLALAGTSDRITVASHFTSTSQVGIETIRFADGTVWGYDAILAEVLTPTAGNDTLIGDGAANLIEGQDGNDRLEGANGNDTLDGGAGNDTMIGGAGDDLFFVDASTDVVMESGSQGTDEVRATAASFTLGGNIERLVYTGSGDFAGTGSSGAETIIGGAGADTLRGMAGNDNLQGSDGADVLVGGAGADTLTGGAGADSFRYELSSEPGVGASADRVLDFSQADGDLINLSAIDANTAVTGDQAFSFIGTGAFVSGTRGQLRYENRADGNTWVQADLDGNLAVDFEIVLIGSRTLTAADFVL